MDYCVLKTRNVSRALLEEFVESGDQTVVKIGDYKLCENYRLKDFCSCPELKVYIELDATK
jgi:hypothetical protein